MKTENRRMDGLVDGNLTGTGKEAGRVMRLHPQGFSCKSEDKLGVGAVVGESGAAQDKQSERMVLARINLMGKGKRVGTSSSNLCTAGEFTSQL